MRLPAIERTPARRVAARAVVDVSRFCQLNEAASEPASTTTFAV
jgi:hypothetical protein